MHGISEVATQNTGVHRYVAEVLVPCWSNLPALNFEVLVGALHAASLRISSTYMYATL
jgi:hypothetical protein